jgi:cytosine/adenosine deaminase-related metal-dependent hydrolase
MSLASGVEAVGDIASDPAVADARREAGLAGISFDELFGLGPPWDQEALDRIAATTTEGLQPHAPYSAGPSILKAAVSTGLPLSTHLAETRDELQFISQGTGPFLDFLKRLGKWSPDFADDYGHGLSPVQWMQPYLKQAQWLVAHCNYVSDDDIQILADAGTSVAYCPVASDYFGHRNHRYRELLEAGVNVCLGTDSIVCQPATARQPLSILDQMRHLYRRDMTSPQLLLEMATANGRGALGLQDENRLLSAVVFEPADSTDPLIQVLKSDRPVSVIVLENSRPMLGESK